MRRDAGERFEPFDRSHAETDERLVVVDDPVIVQRRLQHALGNRSPVDLMSEGRVKHRGTAPAERLGLVHGGIGFLDQRFRRPSSGDRYGNADARRDTLIVAAPVGGVAQRGNESVADVDRVQVVVDGGSEHDELVAADTSDRVHRPEDCSQPCGDAPQHGISGGMALRVVDLLEPVEVDEEHDGAPASALGVRQRLTHTVDEQRPIGQSGQCVVGRLPGEGRLCHLQLGHPVGLRLAESRDLVILLLLLAEVCEREAGELITFHLEGRGLHQERHGLAGAGHQIELEGRAQTTGTSDLVQADQHDSPASSVASGDPTIVSLGRHNISANRRFAYRMMPLDESVAAPSRMFSTKIR